MKPMLLTDVGTDIAPYLSDDWMLQQKHDGARVIFTAVYYDSQAAWETHFLNRQGKDMTFAAAAQKFDALTFALLSKLADLGVNSIALDGELIIEDGVYHVFDLLGLDLYDIRFNGVEHTLLERDALLHGELAPLESDLVKFAVTASTPDQKSQMWHLLQEAGVEGAVSKRWDSLYVPGTRSKDWVKHKLVKTADVVVINTVRTFKESNGIVETGSATLGVPIDPYDDPTPFVNTRGKRFAATGRTEPEPGKIIFTKPEVKGGLTYDPRDMLPVGNASLIGKELTIEPGSVVEVNYLYWTGDAMIQPRIVSQRFDKAAADCDLAQFPAYTREAVQLPQPGFFEQKRAIDEILAEANGTES